MSIAGQLPWLVLAVFVVGTPHGALDHRLARGLLQPWLGRRWLAAFLLLYVAAGAVTLALWLALPALALASFLLIAAVHFGSHDSPSGQAMPVLVRGFLPPVMAAAAFRPETALIFGWIAGPGGAGLVELLAGPGLWLWLCGALVVLVREPGWRDRGELLGLAALFALAPPLLAFALYFALVHTPRALRESKGPGESWRQLLLAALPFSLAAIALAGVGYLLLRSQLALEPALVRTVFTWLGALTVPHMLLAVLVRRNNPTAAGPSWPRFPRPAAGG